MASYEFSMHYELFYKDGDVWVKLGSVKYNPELDEYVFVADGDALYLTEDDLTFVQTKLSELNTAK